MALTHIFACVLLIVMASLRVRSWRRWEEGVDGAKSLTPPASAAAIVAAAPPPPPPSSSSDAAATAAAAALEDGSSALGAGVPSRKRVSFPEEIEGNGTAAPAATATAAVTASPVATAATAPSRRRRRSVLLQRPAELEGFWAKLGEICICMLRQLLVLFPVTKREYLDMREAWLAAHRLSDGSGVGGKGNKSISRRCCCSSEKKSKGDGKEEGDGSCCACGCAVPATPPLPSISFADYVMKSFDDDVAGIVGLVRRETFSKK